MDDIRKVFGDQLISYLLASDEPSEAIRNPSPGQQTVITQLEEITAHTADQHPTQRRIGISNALLSFIQETQNTWANQARASCDGRLLTLTETGDTVLDQLATLGRDIFPVFLMPPPEDEIIKRSSVSISGGVHNHPLQIEFCRSALKDGELKLLFPGISENFADSATNRELFDVSSEIIFSNGRGNGFQLVTLATTLLNAAAVRMAFRDSVEVTRYIDFLTEVLAETRSLARGRRTSVPAVMTYANVTVPSDLAVKLPWGTLRGWKASDAWLLKEDDNARLVLDGQISLQILSKRKSSPANNETLQERMDKAFPKFEAWSKDFERLSDLTRYSLLLASPGDDYITTDRIGHAIHNPLSFSPWTAWRADNPMFPHSRQSLTADNSVAIESWSRRLANHPKSLRMAMRRTLTAVSSRVDPMDGFIDAVIAWENMFSSSPETTFKVCGAIAALLRPDNFDERLKLFATLQDLYRKRSGIVHGGEEPSVREILSYRDQAVKIAVDCMRQLHGNEPLLQLAGSDLRSKHLLLGFKLASS